MFQGAVRTEQGAKEMWEIVKKGFLEYILGDGSNTVT